MTSTLSDIQCRIPTVSKIVNPTRRKECKYDFLKFCETYFPKLFHTPRTFQAEFCRDIQILILAKFRKKNARAAPRGLGKTTIAVLASIWALLYGHKRCIVWFCVNEAKAKERLDIIQNELISNRRLGEDFPETCDPIRAEGWQDNWSDDGHMFSNGSWVLGKGIDGANLGTNKLGLRPDLIAIDDPEDTSTIRKTGINEQTKTAQKRFDRIDKEIAYLPETIQVGAFLMVTTIRSRGCLSDEFTDPRCKAAWEGKVYKAMKLPMEGDAEYAEHKRLWKTFGQICGAKEGPHIKPEDFASDEETPQTAAVSLDVYHSLAPTCRKALRFYAKHIVPMRAGIVELDPIRCPIWNFYWQVYSDDRGEEIVWSELQNEPLEDENTKLMRFDEQMILSHCVDADGVSVHEGGVYPNSRILIGVQMGLQFIHYEVKCCFDDFKRKHLVTCDRLEVKHDGYTRDEALTNALVELEKLFEKWSPLNPLIAVNSGGTVGSDKSEWSECVMRFTAQRRPRWFCFREALTWSDVNAATAFGRNWACKKEGNPYGVFVINATHYKNRAATSYRGRSTLTLFKSEPHNEQKLWEYARHQCSEQYMLVYNPDKPAAKAYEEAWITCPKYRSTTAWWYTAVLIECLADVAPILTPARRAVPNSLPRRNTENARTARRF